MSTLSIKILNPKARNVIDGLASDGLIEVGSCTFTTAEYQQKTSGGESQTAIDDAMHEADRRYNETFRRLAQ